MLRQKCSSPFGQTTQQAQGIPHIPLFALRFERSGALQFEPLPDPVSDSSLTQRWSSQLLAAKLGRAIAPADEIISHQASGTATSPVRIPLSNFGDENNQERFVDELEHVPARPRCRWGSMSLKNLALSDAYRSDRNNLVADFYAPCLAEAESYDRAVGYFSRVTP